MCPSSTPTHRYSPRSWSVHKRQVPSPETVPNKPGAVGENSHAYSPVACPAHVASVRITAVPSPRVTLCTLATPSQDAVTHVNDE